MQTAGCAATCSCLCDTVPWESEVSNESIGPGGVPVHKILQPPSWPRSKGYANGIRARGDMVFVSGMVGWDDKGCFATGFVAQTRQALENVVAVLAQGGALPAHIVRLTWYVVDIAEYRHAQSELGAVYRAVIGNHFPTMALVAVSDLVEPQARLEIEATAIIPPTPG
jgi:enamine deaminase RidA (YjgF/YER057c/UK114 family)